jgi:hypothetical protein
LQNSSDAVLTLFSRSSLVPHPSPLIRITHPMPGRHRLPAHHLVCVGIWPAWASCKRFSLLIKGGSASTHAAHIKAVPSSADRSRRFAGHFGTWLGPGGRPEPRQQRAQCQLAVAHLGPTRMREIWQAAPQCSTAKSRERQHLRPFRRRQCRASRKTFGKACRVAAVSGEPQV